MHTWDLSIGPRRPWNASLTSFLPFATPPISHPHFTRAVTTGTRVSTALGEIKEARTEEQGGRIRESCKNSESPLETGWEGSRSALNLETVSGPRRSPPPRHTHTPPHSKASVKFWEFPNPSVGLRQIFPDASVPCPPRPLGGAAPGTERGKRGRAGGLSSHSREAAAAEPGSAAAAHRAPPAGRSGAARWAERSPGREEAGRR